ncbi:MAG TPA: guanylate kinase [Gemmatimonadales bacterium]|nr:guanylate kinase [Gemmatimonadales bacterium]
MTPRIVVLSAPSGGGKTTIAKALRERFPDRFGFSVSATTRKPRAGEHDAADYHFWDRARFEQGLKNGKFLEHAEYAGELYGTLRDEVEKVLTSGRHVVLDIEVEGARQVKSHYAPAESVSIFILPTEPRVLIERLMARKSENADQLRKRIERAKYELQQATQFDRWIRNDVLDDAVDAVVKAVDEDRGFRRTKSDLKWLDQYGSELQAQAQQLWDELHHQKG